MTRSDKINLIAKNTHIPIMVHIISVDQQVISKFGLFYSIRIFCIYGEVLIKMLCLEK